MEPQGNLCPYFWSLMIAIIFTPILLILAIPLEITRCITKLAPKKYEIDLRLDSIKDIGLFSEYSVLSFVAIIAWAALFILLTPLVLPWTSRYEGFHAASILCWAIIIFFYFRYRWIKAKDRKANEIWRQKMDGQYPKPEPNIFIEFIKAKYKRYCPSIKWKD